MPALHVAHVVASAQIPPSQTSPSAQALVQAPQLSGSVSRSTHPAAQIVSPSSHEGSPHSPAVHGTVLGHVISQDPQWKLSEKRSKQPAASSYGSSAAPMPIVRAGQ